MIQLLHGDCLELMRQIPDGSVDMILTDLPYGTTRNAWDSIIPFEQLWLQYGRLIKPSGAIVLFGSQPFTTHLINSNLGLFKYCLVWDKQRTSGAFNANHMPLKAHEDIIIFSKAAACSSGKIRMAYYPIMTTGKMMSKGGAKKGGTYGAAKEVVRRTNDQYYPRSVLSFKACHNMTGKLHPTEKPIDLLEYLICTYTQEGETVLDSCVGSGSTMVACQNTGRHGIGIEKDADYFEIARQRIEAQAA